MPVYQKKDKEGKILKDTKGNSWYYRCYYIDIYGNKKQRESKKFKSKGEAIKAEAEFLTSIKNANELDINVSFTTVYDSWLEYKMNKVKITTYYCLKKKIDKHILDFFKDYKLHSIKLNILNNWKKHLIAKNLSINTINALIGYLVEILKYANIYYEYDIKLANYLTKVRDDSPKQIKKESETNFWTIEEFNTFISAVDNNFYKIVFIFLYRTGLRIGELMALNWNDIDFNKKTLSINKSLSHDSFDQASIIVSPKTNNSIRIIDIDDYLIELLKKYKKEESKIYGFENQWFIFGGVKHLGLTTLRRHLNIYIKKANVKKITIHGFRHSHVSMLIYLGCDIKDVAERIGDTIQMVESTYYHMFPTKKKKTLDKLNSLKI